MMFIICHSPVSCIHIAYAARYPTQNWICMSTKHRPDSWQLPSPVCLGTMPTPSVTTRSQTTTVGAVAQCAQTIAAVVILPRDISEVGLCWGPAIAGVGEPHLQILLHTLKEMGYSIVWSLIGTCNITVVLEVYAGLGHWITEGSVTSVVAVAAGWSVHRSGHLAQQAGASRAHYI